MTPDEFIFRFLDDPVFGYFDPQDRPKVPQLYLRDISQVLRPLARAALKAGDVGGFFCRADSMVSLSLFRQNVNWFKAHGLYEKALVEAWTNQKITATYSEGVWTYWSNWMRNWVSKCDRAKLLAAGDPLPQGEELSGASDTALRFPAKFCLAESLANSGRFAGHDG